MKDLWESPRYIDLRSQRLTDFVLRHPRQMMPLVYALFRAKYALRRAK